MYQYLAVHNYPQVVPSEMKELAMVEGMVNGKHCVVEGSNWMVEGGNWMVEGGNWMVEGMHCRLEVW